MVDLNAIVGETLKYGFPGVVIIVLAYVLVQVVKQAKQEMKEKDAELKVEREKNEALQEKRIAEARESMNALNGSTNVLQDLLAAVSSISNAKGG